jgi:molybdenum cofactor guanylyltransferase
MNQTDQSGRQRLGGIILAGGKSRRMGTDKAELRLNGLTFVEHLVSRFRSMGLPLVIVGSSKAACKLDQMASAHARILLANDQRTDAGPLEGIRVGLSELEKFAEFGFVISCDSPLMKLEVAEYLLNKIGSSQASVPRSKTEIYGTTAVYRTDIHRLIEQELSEGNHSVKYMLSRLDAQFVDVDELRAVDPKLVTLININTPQEYQAALRQFGG